MSPAESAATGTRSGHLAQASTIAHWLTPSNPNSRWIAGRTAFTTTKLSWTTRELPEVTLMEKITAGGDETAAAMAKELHMLRTTFPELITTTYSGGVSVAKGAGRNGMGVDLTDKFFGTSFRYDVVPGYNNAKDHFTYAHGGHLG